MIMHPIGADPCNICNEPVFFVQKYMGDWMKLDTKLIETGPRYSLHQTPSGAPFACRESHVKGYKHHACADKNKPPTGGHTPQLF